MESSQRQVVCDNVEGYFFSSWPYEDRLSLRKFYDLYVAKWVCLMQQNEAAGGRLRDDCSQWSLWRSLAMQLRSSCNLSVQEEEIEHFFRRVICGVSCAHQVSDLLDSLLFPEQLFVVVDDADDYASYRNEGEDGPDVKLEVMDVVDAPEPHIAASGTPAAREHVEEVNECHVLGATGWSLLAQRTSWEGFRSLSDGAHEAVPPGRPSKCDKLTAAQQEFVADVESSRREVVSDNGERYFFSSWPYEDRLCLRKFYHGHVAKWAYLMQQNEAAGGRRRDDCSQWSLWREAAMALRSSCNRLVQEEEIEHFFRRVICGVARPDQVSDFLDSLLFPEQLCVVVSHADDYASYRNGGEVGPDVKREVIEVVDAPEPHIAAPGTPAAREHVEEVNERHVLGATGWSLLAQQRTSWEGFRPLSDGAHEDVPPGRPSKCDKHTAVQQEFVADVEDSQRKVVSDNGERYFFSSWPYEDRLCLRKFYDGHVAKWAYLMQQNEAASGRLRDDCSQWSLWRSAAMALRTSCNQSVQEKEIEHFFRRVICGVSSPDQVSDLLDYLLFPEKLFVAVADAGDNASDRNESEDGADVNREVTEVVYAPEPHIAASSASGAREHVGEQTMKDRCVLGATGGILPAEQRTSPESLRLVSDYADEAVPTVGPSECDKRTGANQSDVVPVFSENDTSAAVLGDDVTIDISIVDSYSDDHDIVLAGIRVAAPNAQEDEVLARKGDAAVAPSTDTTVLRVPHVRASAAGVDDLGDNAAVAISGSVRASPMLRVGRGVLERRDDAPISSLMDTAALSLPHIGASIAGVTELADDAVDDTWGNSMVLPVQQVRTAVVEQADDTATSASINATPLLVPHFEESIVGELQRRDDEAVSPATDATALPVSHSEASIVGMLERGDDAAASHSTDTTLLPVPLDEASIIGMLERGDDAASSHSTDATALPAPHSEAPTIGVLERGHDAAASLSTDATALPVPHFEASTTGMLERGDDAAASQSTDATALPVPYSEASTTGVPERGDDAAPRHSTCAAALLVPYDEARMLGVLERAEDVGVSPSTNAAALSVPHSEAPIVGVLDRGDDAVASHSTDSTAWSVPHDEASIVGVLERGDDTGVIRSTDSTAFQVPHSEASIVGVPEHGYDAAVVTSEDSTTLSLLHVGASIPDLLQHGNDATFTTLGVGIVLPVQRVRTSVNAVPKHGDGAAVGTSASPKQYVVTSIVRALECGDDATVATSDATALPVPRLEASIVGELERVGEAAAATSEEDAASPSHIGASIAGVLGLGEAEAVVTSWDEATLAVPHVAASITGIREGATVAISGDAGTLPFSHVGTTTALSYCANGHFLSNNLIYGSHSEGSYSAEDHVKCRTGGLEEDICGSACDSLCSVRKRCDKEIQHTPERVDREVQCEIDLDYSNEFMEAEDTLLIEITRLYQRMLQMQEDPME